MRKIELKVDELVGYAVIGAEEDQVRKLGTAKLGFPKSPAAEQPSSDLRPRERSLQR